MKKMLIAMSLLASTSAFAQQSNVTELLGCMSKFDEFTLSKSEYGYSIETSTRDKLSSLYFSGSDIKTRQIFFDNVTKIQKSADSISLKLKGVKSIINIKVTTDGQLSITTPAAPGEEAIEVIEQLKGQLGLSVYSTETKGGFSVDSYSICTVK